MNLFWVWFWLAVGNYAYQFFGSQLWMVAFDRAYFQAIAISGVWLASKMSRLSVTSPIGDGK